MLALCVYGAVLARAYALAPRAGALTLLLGAVGAGLLVVMLVRGHDDLLGAALLMLGTAYVLGLFAARHILDESAPLVGAGMLLCAELATWSLDDRPRVPAARTVSVARSVALGGLVVGGLGASALVLVVAAAPSGSGLAWTVAGAAAAVGAIGVAARLGR